VFLVDVDNTLLDNDRIRLDIQEHLEREYGAAFRERYWDIQEQLFVELGYRDYLGSVQRQWLEHPDDMRSHALGGYLLEYPFADRLYPGALEVLGRFRSWGQTVVLTDGDAVFQPHKARRAGIHEAVGGDVLVYVHKEHELADVEQRYPAEHYVVVDDKLRILTAVKNVWGERVTTVFTRQGQFAHDAEVIASYPPADVAIEGIGDLLAYDLPTLIGDR
jgi:FMN phosphatase YigB (HAD superfamily)